MARELMSFVFKKENDFYNLPPKLKIHFSVFLKKRIKDVMELNNQIYNNDYSGLKSFIHKQLGIAASYHLFQFAELVEELADAAKEENEGRIKEMLVEMTILLETIKIEVHKWPK